VPLSEHEQRLLEQMERALYAEDPKFASALRGADPRTHYRRRVVKASIGFVAGIALLMTGVITQLIPVSVIGFVLMLGSAFFALSSWRQIPSAEAAATTNPASPRPPGRKAKSRTSIMNRFEERWNRRRDDPGR
jgi:hypothetical protein